MYNLKKVIASICVIAMMLTTVAFGATFTDVAEDSAYYEAVETLNKLGIVTGYEDGTYKPEEGVTRAEMAALIARIQGFGDSAKAQTATIFTDVDATHWASGYIANAAASGIINGKGNGIFDPEANVLFEEAVKMVMATLGYTPYADYNGGYPGGYMAAAQRYNVLTGVSNATMGTNANRGTIAQLLANAIDTPLMTQQGWNTNGEVEYMINDGKSDDAPLKTLMSEYLNVVKVRGVVTANAYTDIYDANKEIDLEAEAAIDMLVMDAFDTTNKDFEDVDPKDDYTWVDTTFGIGESDAAEFIGRSVVAYVQESDGDYDYEIVSIVLDTARNDELAIDLSQFNTIGDKFEYYKTTTAKTATAVTLASDVTVVYNNVGGYKTTDIFGDIVAEDGATLDGGKITLIDNNDAKGYDVIFVEVAETAVIDEAEEGYATFKEVTATNGISELEVDEDDTDRVVVVTKDGAEIALADLVEWDVLSIIAADDDAAYILAEVISNKVTGTITSEAKSTTSATGSKYTISGAKYDVANGAYGIAGIGVGDGGEFFIDKYGKIAAFNDDPSLVEGAAPTNYAYVTAVADDVDILTGKTTAIFQLVTADGVVALNLKSTGAKLNGVSVNADDDMDDLEAAEGKVVKYSKNSSNLITAINVLEDDEEVTSVAVDAEGEYDAEDIRFVGAANFFLDTNSYVFFISETDAEDSFLGTEADLSDGESYTVYDRFADKKADDNNIVVVKLEAGSAGRKANLAVITSVGTSENEDGEQILAIEAITKDGEVVADTTNDVYGKELVRGVSVADVLTPGDIVKIKVSANGVITAIDVVYDFNEDVRAKDASDLADYAVVPEAQYYTASGDEEIYGGKVTDYRKNSTTATIEGEAFKLSQAANVIVIDANGRKLEVKKGSASSFKYFEKLYAADVTSVDVTVNDELFEGATQADAQCAVDYVYARKYDNRVTDVIIVKGPEDIKVR